MQIWKREKIVRKLFTFVEKAKKHNLNEENNKSNVRRDPLGPKLVKIEAEVMKWIPTIKDWESKLVEQLKVLEQHLDEEKIWEKLEIIIENIESIKELLARSKKSSFDYNPKGKQKMHDDEDGDHPDKQQMQLDSKEEPQLESKMYFKFQKCYDSLETHELKACYLCLSIFPENSIIKKKPLIYLWIAEGFVLKTNGRTAEEVGEEVFEELIEEGFLIPYIDHHSPSVNSCTIHPLARRTLMFLAKSVHFFDFDDDWRKPLNNYYRAFLFKEKKSDPISIATELEETLGEYLTVFNLNVQYLQLADWLSKLKNVRVLQLGRWQKDVAHHIEVENQDSAFNPDMKRDGEDVYLNGLGTQDSLKYLSLRGVSRMTSLPPAVAHLRSLEILDLRDCQGLQKLPFNISSLSKLTHLDLSECYLLESMPRGIEKLSSLQVLKGFVLGIGIVRKDQCKVNDLVNLKQLRKLSIRIRQEAIEVEDFNKLKNFKFRSLEIDKDFNNLKDFKSLKILVISWSGARVPLDSFTVPPNLKKLELKCTPIEIPAKWFAPDHLKCLEKLYIRGGKLTTLTQDERNESHWRVKILILKYLKKFDVRSDELKKRFPELEYLDKIGCSNNEGDVKWRKEEKHIEDDDDKSTTEEKHD